MFENERRIARKLCLEAGAMVLERRASSDLAVALKAGDLGPVTEADLAADRLISAGLREAFPDDAIITEESEAEFSSAPSGRVWMVDPIDGTREFIAGRADFAVMIGLVQDGAPLLGFVYQPVSETLTWGVVGDGAFQQVGAQAPRAIHVSDCDVVSDARMARSRSHPSEAVTELCAILELDRWSRMGSFGVKTMHVSAGAAELYVNLSGRTAVWDSAGPVAILLAAGGRFTSGKGDSIDYREVETFHTEGVVISNGLIHDAVLEGIRALKDSTG